jgi:putative DNA primase/helicase
MSDSAPRPPINAHVVRLLQGADNKYRKAGDDFQTEILPPEFSDDALALRFADRHERDLRFVAKWGRWLRWDKTCWRMDDTLLAFDLARAACRQAARRCDKAGVANSLLSAKTVAAVERLAKADRRLAATVDQWDLDPWLLNIGGSDDDR